MSFIFMLVFIALVTLWIFSFIGLVNPKKWQRLHKNKDVTRKDVFIGCIAGSAILIIVMVVIAPDPVNDVQNKNISVSVIGNEKAEAENIKINYEIISEDKRRNITRKVSVELPERISEQQLRQIANEIKNEDSNSYERTFIMYRIKGEKSISAWATTHFDPNLDINFIGLDASHYETLTHQNFDVNGEIIGRWLATVVTDYVTVFYKDGGNIYKKDFFINDVSKPIELVENNNKYKVKGSDENVYYLIDDKGDLEYWGESGNFATAKKVIK